jgi:NAD(P)H-nitrite reductase large subunit
VVLRDRRVIGAILVGDVSARLALSRVFESNARLSDAEVAALIAPTRTKAVEWARVA